MRSSIALSNQRRSTISCADPDGCAAGADVAAAGGGSGGGGAAAGEIGAGATGTGPSRSGGVAGFCAHAVPSVVPVPWSNDVEMSGGGTGAGIGAIAAVSGTAAGTCVASAGGAGVAGPAISDGGACIGGAA